MSRSLFSAPHGAGCWVLGGRQGEVAPGPGAGPKEALGREGSPAGSTAPHSPCTRPSEKASPLPPAGCPPRQRMQQAAWRQEPGPELHPGASHPALPPLAVCWQPASIPCRSWHLVICKTEPLTRRRKMGGGRWEERCLEHRAAPGRCSASIRTQSPLHAPAAGEVGEAGLLVDPLHGAEVPSKVPF